MEDKDGDRIVRELYKKIDGWEDRLKRCPFCGCHAELYEHEPTPGHYNKVSMCSNEDCPMYMPPEEFYRATKAEAAEIWNKRVGEPPSTWLPIETAPRDGTSVLLLIEDAEHPLQDSNTSVSIGSYGVNGGPEEDPKWCFAGWCWNHDHYVRGKGTPTHWLPILVGEE